MGATECFMECNLSHESHSNVNSSIAQLLSGNLTEGRERLLHRLLPNPPSLTLIPSSSCAECVSHHLLFEHIFRYSSLQHLRPFSITLHPSPSSSPPEDINQILEQETENGAQLFFISFASAAFVHILVCSSWLSHQTQSMKIRSKISFVIAMLPEDASSSPFIDSCLLQMANSEPTVTDCSSGEFLLPSESVAIMLYGAVCGMAAATFGSASPALPEEIPFVMHRKVLAVLHRFAQAASNILNGSEHLQRLLDEEEQDVEDEIYTLSRHALVHSLPCGCVMFPYACNPSNSVPKCVPPPAIHDRVLRAMKLQSNVAEKWWENREHSCEVNYLRQSYLHHLRGADLDASLPAHLSYMQLFHAHRPSNALYALLDQINIPSITDWELKEAIEWLAKAFRASEALLRVRMCSESPDVQHNIFEKELAFQVFGRLALYRTRNEVVRKFVSGLELSAGATRRDAKGTVEDF